MLKENTWYKIKSKDKLFYNTKNSYGYYICYKGLCINKKMLRFNKVFAKNIYYWKNGLQTFDYYGYMWQEWMLEPICPLIMETE